MALGEAFHRNVISQIAERLDQRGKRALLIFDPANIRYATGFTFTPTDRPLAACVWSDARVALYVPHLEAEHATSAGVRDVHWYAEYPAEEPPVRWMAREVGGPLAVDAVGAADWQEIAAEVEDAELWNPIAELRAVKTPPEIDLIARAAEYADLALERAFARVTSGSSEQDALADVTAAVDAIMRSELGDLYEATGPALSGTIRSGTAAASPNSPTSGRKLTRGDSVIVEFTARVGGYHAQAGSTFFVGDPLRDVVRWVEATIQAQATAREALVPGATAQSVDQAARKTIERLGLGNGLRHRTGQGIGLSRGEAPWLVRSETTPLETGMVVVLRPGVYIPGRTGARNSETIVIEEDGPRVLNPRIERWGTPEARLKEF